MKIELPPHLIKQPRKPRKIKAAHVRKFEKLAKGLDDLMKEILMYKPEANIYLAEDSLHLMQGDSHEDGYASVARQDQSIACVRVRKSGGGDW